MTTTGYTDSIKRNDHIMTVKEFISEVTDGSFIDYDGFCSPVKDGKLMCVFISPSQISTLPDDATHVVWYNR